MRRASGWRKFRSRKRLGVSRTPVRLAFRTLEQEGLLEKTGKRGLVVRAISQADVQCAIEVRGALEGLAARRLAERGLSDDQRDTLRACVAEGTRVLAKGHLVEDDIGAWSQLNERFHRTIVEGTDSRVIADAIARNDHLPFASASSISIDRDALKRGIRKTATGPDRTMPWFWTRWSAANRRGWKC